MKKVVLAVLVAVCAAALVACGDDSSTGASGEESDSSRSGLSGETRSALIQVVDAVPGSYYEAVNAGARDAAERLGLTNVQFSQSNADPLKDVASIDDAIAKGAKAVIINPNSSEAVGPVLERANEDGLCSVLMYSNILDTPQDQVAPGAKAFVGWDERVAARALAMAMGEAMNGKGGVAFIGGIPSQTGNKIREDVARETFENEFPEIEWLGSQPTNFDPARARAVTQDFLQQHGDKVTGIMTVADVLSAAAVDVVEKSPQAGEIVLTGFGAEKQFVDDIKAGRGYATVPFAPRSDTERAMELAAECIEGDRSPVVALTPDLPVLEPLRSTGYVLTAENVDEFAPQW